MGKRMGRGRWTALALVLALPLGWHACASGEHLGSLTWTRRTGGALGWRDRLQYLGNGAPLLKDWAVASFAGQPGALELSRFDPPESAIVRAALARLREIPDPEFAPFVNHSIRLGYWTLVVMSREHPNLTPTEIEEAWVAALLHDIGLASPPERGEFTLGGVRVVEELGNRYSWSAESVRRASEAITLNPNSRVDRDRDGLLAWAMSVGGQGETFYGPYRRLMSAKDVRALEAKYPRDGLFAGSARILARELERTPNQRFGLLRTVGFLWLRRKD
jgi:hypothetical protein